MQKLTDSYVSQSLPKLGFGLMRLPIDGEARNINLEKTIEMADAYMAAGMNYFDTAYMYHEGESEKIFRKGVLERYPRESFFVADKLPIWYAEKAEDVEKIFNLQLSRTGITYFDFYLLHAMNGERYAKCVELGVFEFVKRMQEKGRIHHFGFSFHGTLDDLKQMLEERPEFEFVQLQLNYYDWESIHADELYHEVRKHGKQIIIMEPIRGGALANLPPEIDALLKNYDANASAASWAVRYCASLPGVMTVLSGMSNIAQMKDNLAYMKDFRPLNEREQAVIEEAARMLREIPTVPCTACKYCADCPIGIPIDEVFKIYNDYLAKKQYANFRSTYNEIEQNHRAADCISCGLCASVCPQGIAIPKQMETIAVLAAN